MKLLPLGLLIACVFIAACSHHRPPPRRPAPSPKSLPQASPTPVVKPPAVASPKVESAPAPWPVRRAPAFTPETLPERLALSPAQILALRDDIRRWLAAPRSPAGKELKLYSSGVTTLDHWLHYGPRPRHSPPDTSTYYQMVYRGGYPTEVYRHEAAGLRIVQRVYYAEAMIPVCSIHYGRDEQPTSFTHLTYEPSGLIRQVVVLDAQGEPVRSVCHAHEGVYSRTETTHYNLKSNGARSGHTLHENDRIYRIAPDGSRKEVNRGAHLWWLTRLSSFGVKPLYPLPVDFIVPSFDRFGSPQHRPQPDA